MKKVSKITKLEIVDLFMDDTIKNGKLPKRVSRFCEDNHIEIEDFNKHFEDFKSLETYIFEVFYENTIRLLYANEDFNDFEPQDKVLSFYYTFFELLTANRDFVKICLGSKNKFARILVLKDLREQYVHFIENINIEFINIPVAQIDKAKDKAISNISWVKLMLTIEYWLNDDSPAFEKTDVLIEKSVQTAFQILDTTTMSSVFDLGKFLVKDIFPNKKK